MEHRSRPLHLVPRLAADDIAAFLPFSYCTLRGRVRSPGHFVRPRSCAHIGPAALGMLYIDTPEGCQHGTHKRARLHTRHLLLLESTHTNTHKHTPQSTLYHFTAERFCPFQPACDGATRTWFGPGASSDRRFHGSWQQRSVPHYGGTDFYQASQLAPLPYGFYRALPFEQRALVQT